MKKHHVCFHAAISVDSLLSAIEHLKGYILHLKFALNNTVSQFLNNLSNFSFFSCFTCVTPRMKLGCNFGLSSDSLRESSERVRVYSMQDTKFVSALLENMLRAHLNNREKAHI